MLYHNTKFRFALADGAPPEIRGGIIAASAMQAGQLVRRLRGDIRKWPYLQHRLFDPQLYLCGLDKNISRKVVANLATQPWFGSHSVPAYDSSQHGSMKQYRDAHEQDLVDSWLGHPLEDEGEIEEAIRACVEFQIELGCEGVILPSPLTTMATLGYEQETTWLDIGARICRDLRTAVPVYATVALSDIVLRGVPAFKNPLLETITTQVASRSELDGAYVVIEQSVDSGYACTSRDTLVSLLAIADDLKRGASRQVLVNYIGTFGAVLSAVGVSIWASGYYRGQRRLRLADYEDTMGLAQPRFFSPTLLGDIGLETDLPLAYAKGYGKSVIGQPTIQSTALMAALEAATYPASTPQWQYRTGNLTAATAHYLAANDAIGNWFDSLEPSRRIDHVHRCLKKAAKLANELAAFGMKPPYSDTSHQSIWLAAFEEWQKERP